MQRLDIFRSGLPAILAGIGLLIFTYLAVVRRDRLARYWAAAWGLLLARYILNGLYDDQRLLTSYANAVVRTAFASVLFAGVWSLERQPLRARWLIAAALLLPALGHTARVASNVPLVSAVVTLSVQAVLLGAAAVMLARTASLPRAERYATAITLICYAVISTIAPRLANGSTSLVLAVAASSVCLLLITFGLFAIYFRQAYDSELRAITATSAQLTHALGEFVSVCMHCRAVQDEQRHWQPLEEFVLRQGRTQLSHGLCETCADKHYGDYQYS